MANAIAHLKKLSILFLGVLILGNLQAQKVAVVLSGGGASAFAHIGFLKALEENSIPIDYIAGASMGAIVGGLYASGYSPEEIEQLMTSESFLKEVKGALTEDYNYFFKKSDRHADWITVKLGKKGELQKSLPTHLIDPLLLDFELLRLTGDANAIAKQNFDSLFVPFRCVASDVALKKTKVLKSGALNRAIRASATYPFYVRAIEINEQLLFDGGLYNNFPVDVAIEEFNPEIILGCNVSYNYEAPTSDDLISQVKNMLVSTTDYSLRGKAGYIVEPKNDIETFDFNRYQEAITSGYATTLNHIDEIKELIKRKTTRDNLQQQRKDFNLQKRPFLIKNLAFRGIKGSQAKYLTKGILKRKKHPSLAEIRRPFLSIKEDPFIQYIYPDAAYNNSDSTYTISLDVELEKPLQVSFGGNLSNKAINTGFFQVDWLRLGGQGFILSANTYFGKYYSSVNVAAKYFLEGRAPIYFEPFFTLNRWDYFKNRTSFFEDVQPAFVIENEQQAGLNIAVPTGREGKLIASGRYLINQPDYYLTNDFTNADTSDQTTFEAYRIGLQWKHATLNQKQYPTSGDEIVLSLDYVNGFESYTPGSTSELNPILNQQKSWVQLKFTWKDYLNLNSKLTVVPMLDIRLASLYTFSNVTATKIFQPQYNPLTESPTLFLPRYRALNYTGVGLGVVYNLSERFSLRTQHHIFQPINELKAGINNRTEIGTILDKRFYIGSVAAVFQSPLGPVALNFNYYDKSNQPWSIMLNFGYILFNQRSL